MSAETLKDKMRDFKEGKIGSMTVSGADLAEAAQDEHKGAVKGTVQTPVVEEAKKDIFTEADATAALHKGMTPSFLKEETIDITEEDRAAFLKAVMSGERYERPFSLFGGRLTGIFRCRSVAESDGIIAWLSHCVNVKKVDARIEYMTLMRNGVLAAQVKCLRGFISEDFQELPQPYAPTRVPVERKDEKGNAVHDTEIREPGWLGVAEAWAKRPDALVTAIHLELQKFERRYWTMVIKSADQNFWNPAASI